MNIKDNNNYQFPKCTWENTCFPIENKGWSNVRGYGEIINNTLENNKISQDISPWNRIQPLYLPTSTPAEIKYAWSPPISNNLFNNIRSDCNICPKHSQTTYNGCIQNLENPTIHNYACPKSTWENQRVSYLNK
jgi:hypothetical protein